MSHSSLGVFYEDLFKLVHEKRFASISEIEDMIPFERDVYISLIKDKEEREAEKKRQEAAIKEAMSRRGY